MYGVHNPNDQDKKEKRCYADEDEQGQDNKHPDAEFDSVHDIAPRLDGRFSQGGDVQWPPAVWAGSRLVGDFAAAVLAGDERHLFPSLLAKTSLLVMVADSTAPGG